MPDWTAQDSDGELLRLDLFVSPRGGNPLHIHPPQEEYFKAVSGTLGVQIGDEHRWLREGEEAVVPPGIPTDGGTTPRRKRPTSWPNCGLR